MKISVNLRLLLLLMIIAPVALGAHSSAPRVKFKGFLDLDIVRPGQQARVIFEAILPNGFHVNSNAPMDEFLKPTRLELEPLKGLTVNEVVYPEPLLFKTTFSDKPLAVYENRFLIGASIQVTDEIEFGDYPVTATLRYQACTIKVCYPPTTRTVEVILRVGAASRSSNSEFADLFEAVRFTPADVDI